MGDVRFREAVAVDADALGVVHVAAWREAYAGLLPDDMLRDLSVNDRIAMWRAMLDEARPIGPAGVFVAESAGAIVGLGACGAQRDAGLKARGYDGEIGALYVLGLHQRAGIGAALMRLMARNLLDHGASAAALWVLRDNVPARIFYESLGCTLVGERAAAQATMPAEVAYGWSDLSNARPSSRT